MVHVLSSGAARRSRARRRPAHQGTPCGSAFAKWSYLSMLAVPCSFGKDWRAAGLFRVSGLCQQRFERCVCWSIDCSPSELPSETPSEFPSARCAAL